MASAVFSLAHWFVVDYSGMKWDTRSPSIKMHLKHAQMLINPRTKKDGIVPEAFDPEDVKVALQAMVEGVYQDWKKDRYPSTMLIVLCGNPPFVKRDILKYLPPRPPIRETVALKQWNEKYSHLLR